MYDEICNFLFYDQQQKKCDKICTFFRNWLIIHDFWHKWLTKLPILLQRYFDGIHDFFFFFKWWNPLFLFATNWRSSQCRIFFCIRMMKFKNTFHSQLTTFAIFPAINCWNLQFFLRLIGKISLWFALWSEDIDLLRNVKLFQNLEMLASM